MTRPARHGPARPVPAAGTVGSEVDFTAVERLLDNAAVLVRTRGERGEPPAGDHRPRIREAISRAAHLARAGTDTAQPTGRRRSRAPGRRVPTGDPDDPSLGVRDWAMVLAAMEINAALGRGRHCDGHDVTAAARTLAGYGLDVGTLVPVHRYGQVIAYPLGAVQPADLDTDDIIAVSATPHTAGGNLRLLRAQTAAGGARRLLLDAVDGPLSWPEQPTGPDLRVTAWRPVPHRRHPWHSH